MFAFEGVQERLSNCCLCGQDVSEVSRVTTVRFTCPNSVFILLILACLFLFAYVLLTIVVCQQGSKIGRCVAECCSA